MNFRPILITQRLICLLRSLFFPLFYGFLPVFFKIFKKRREFEELNFSDPHSISFKKSNEKAYACFEVSSEGEFEQVKPLILSLIDAGKKVEILYCSPSLEKRMAQFKNLHGERIRSLRLPLLSFSQWSLKGQNILKWVSASRIILCRYDFFPELLLLGQVEGRELLLVQATLKGKVKKLKNSYLYNKYYKALYSLFDKVVFSTELDLNRVKEVGWDLKNATNFEIRTLQIKARLKNAHSTLGKETFWPILKELIEGFPQERRLLLGSAWPNEMKIFSSKKFCKGIERKEWMAVIAPHDLSAQGISQLKEQIKNSCFLPIYEWTSEMSALELGELSKHWKERPGLIVLNIRGVLLELYPYFRNVFIGGGHGRSIHSLLEPYLANARLYCGPKTHRSTEFDIVTERSPDHIIVLEQLEGLFESLNSQESPLSDDAKREGFYGQTAEKYGSFLSDVLEIGPQKNPPVY